MNSVREAIQATLAEYYSSIGQCRKITRYSGGRTMWFSAIQHNGLETTLTIEIQRGLPWLDIPYRKYTIYNEYNPVAVISKEK